MRPLPTPHRATTSLALLALIQLCAGCADRPAAMIGPGGTDNGGFGLEARVTECATPAPGWIWCDDFEQDRTGRYFEHHDAGGAFVRAAGVGVAGSHGMRARLTAGMVQGGNLKVAFGRTPSTYLRPVDAGTANYREVYWRVWVRMQHGWRNNGDSKLSRATILTSSSWSQAAIGHVWTAGEDNQYLALDPASGTDEAGNVRTTKYNDFTNLRWLGYATGQTPVLGPARTDRWQCIEAGMRLNDAGKANGSFDLWIDGRLEARRTGLNWVGAYDGFGINAVFVENYWNDGSPADQERYFDNFVVSVLPIGCGGAPSG